MKLSSYIRTLCLSASIFTVNCFCGANTTDIELVKISDDLTTLQTNTWLSFGAENISKLPTRLDQWIKFAKKELEYDPKNAGFNHFKDVLEQYKEEKISASNQLWVLFGTNAPITEKIDLSTNAENIEISCSMIHAADAICFSNMGIARTKTSKKRQQKNATAYKELPLPLSILLHSFGAKVITKTAPNVLFMITTPVLQMLEIIKRFAKLKENSEIFVDNLSTSPEPIVKHALKTKNINQTMNLFLENHQWLQTKTYQPVLPNENKPRAKRPYMLIDATKLANALPENKIDQLTL